MVIPSVVLIGTSARRSEAACPAGDCCSCEGDGVYSCQEPMPPECVGVDATSLYAALHDMTSRQLSHALLTDRDLGFTQSDPYAYYYESFVQFTSLRSLYV